MDLPPTPTADQPLETDLLPKRHLAPGGEHVVQVMDHALKGPLDLPDLPPLLVILIL